MRSIVRIEGQGKAEGARRAQRVQGAGAEPDELNARVEMIQALIPLGLEAVNDLLQQELTRLAGPRYSRTGGTPGYDRWGGQPGSLNLADQKVTVRVPRVRDTNRGQEVPLASYHALQDPRRANDAALRKVLKGLSCRDSESCVDAVPKTFGLSPSTLSRRFKRASARRQLSGIHTR